MSKTCQARALTAAYQENIYISTPAV